MKIFSAKQTHELDAITIENEPISSVDLMERASLAFVDWFTDRFTKEKNILIFCGPGNNGGDGLAIARLLLNKHYNVEVFIIESVATSKDFKINEERLLKITTANYIHSSNDFPEIDGTEVVIDAIFGSGLTRLVEGLYAEIISYLNKKSSIIVSVDIASGLFCDYHTPGSVTVKPTFTVSFQLPKLAFLLPENYASVGEWHLVDIGLDKNYIQDTNSPYYYLDPEMIRSSIKKRGKFAHKGDFGKALIIAGNYGMIGAALLASKACLRAGVGLLKMYIPQCGYDIAQTSIPEAMVLTDPDFNSITKIPELDGYNAIGVGPGLNEREKTIDALGDLLKNSPVPLVIDAGALNILSKNKDLIEYIPPNSILTPHPKEFERLAGKSENDFERLKTLKHFSQKLQCIVILKGAHTAIAHPHGEIYFNSTGNPGMAKGGSGDVLTGILTSLLAQGYPPTVAAILGVYMHGFAGDTAATSLGIPYITASDIIEGLSSFYKVY